MVYNTLPTYVHTIILTLDYNFYNENKLNAKACAYFDCLLVISAMVQGKKWESKSASKKQVTYTGKKNLIKNHLSTNPLPITRPNVSNASSVV
jgi:hypothetical protein